MQGVVLKSELAWGTQFSAGGEVARRIGSAFERGAGVKQDEGCDCPCAPCPRCDLCLSACWDCPCAGCQLQSTVQKTGSGAMQRQRLDGQWKRNSGKVQTDRVCLGYRSVTVPGPEKFSKPWRYGHRADRGRSADGRLHTLPFGKSEVPSMAEVK